MSLARIQFMSLLTKSITTALGIVQSLIVVRILSPAEFGLVGLVMSVGGVIGVSQHLGVVDGAIREIAVLKKRREIGKVFWVSHIVRQVVTVPLSVGLLLLSGFIANTVYDRPEIFVLLQVFAGALILQGLQDVLGATMTGMKRFGALYVIQIVTAFVNVLVFGYLTWQYGTMGFFWAIIATTLLMVLLLFSVIIRDLQGALAWPNWEDIREYGWRVMRIGAFMYVARIFFIVWQRLPLLLLGGVLGADQLGFLNVSQTFGSKLTIIAMALSEVNLSWMSSLYMHKRDEFKRVVTRNMQRVFMVMLGITMLLLFFTPEILRYVIGAEYLPAQPLILVMTVGFFLYALTDIGTSSVFVPADRPKLRAYTYGVMVLISGAIISFLLATEPNSFMAACAILLGAIGSYVVMIWIAWQWFHIQLVTRQLLVFLGGLGLSLIWLLQEPGFIWRLVIFALLTGYITYRTWRSTILPDIDRVRPKALTEAEGVGIICFAGAPYALSSWTNRQHVMSRMSKHYPVLYVEQRVWILRYLVTSWRDGEKLLSFMRRLLWWEQVSDNLFLKAQWNLIPGSREVRLIARFNHWLNRWHVLLVARLLGFQGGGRSGAALGRQKDLVVWVYDTESTEYLSAFDEATIAYDCVDDHAAQAGVDRNPQRVEQEERRILQRADLVTVTSKALLKMKGALNNNVHLVLNAGDVALYNEAVTQLPDEMQGFNGPVLGSVGALDSYKIDFDLLLEVARAREDWNFVFIGEPVVDLEMDELRQLEELTNVTLLGAKARRDVPAYVQGFDVCLIPYRNNRYNRASFPLKFWEFMASGKPVVVTGVPELRDYVDVIEFVDTPESFVNGVERALASKESMMDQRKKMANEHGWEARVSQLKRLLESVMDD